jgi:hypothetical protein
MHITQLGLLNGRMEEMILQRKEMGAQLMEARSEIEADK